jgi:hypothetical protein
MALEKDLDKPFQDDTRKFAENEADKARWQKEGQELEAVLNRNYLSFEAALTIVAAAPQTAMDITNFRRETQAMVGRLQGIEADFDRLFVAAPPAPPKPTIDALYVGKAALLAALESAWEIGYKGLSASDWEKVAAALIVAIPTQAP